ncbi:MAG: aminotransferase class V-fold PLP-dependent enzyme [Flavobacteriaceae bacterium]|nr:aminotransferase class V-fold PLP-dependent enzyme [Flavobacteriaceae bacterium]NNL33298.1 aminotransferase class V-fold PLP-dependent enzyme [Flavobacteriaceae bacterium]
MSIKDQRIQFDIPQDIVYLNTSYMSPLLKDVSEAGRNAVDQKSRPYQVKPIDFFEPLTHLKSLFARLIDCNQPERIAMIPSVSYGIATVIKNITLQKGDEILTLAEQFPSNIYGWQRLAKESGATLISIAKPEVQNNIGKQWNENILDAITESTAVIAICHTHWADGTLYDLKAIREKATSVNALLIIDGTQSVGALPFSVQEIQPDALICAAYKWLLGPYASGLAYYGPFFDSGKPIEENWSNRLNSENFSGLTTYEERYKPFANRYNMGEQANFIAIPMLTKAIEQLLEWTPEAIQTYCREISIDALKKLEELGCTIESEAYRGHHLFGIKLNPAISLEALKSEFEKRKIFVSIRGAYIRVSIHLFNTKEDLNALVDAVNYVFENK